jgi:hypothetical protein
MDIRLLPSLGRIAKVQELKRIITNASLLVHAISSMHRLVLPLLSKEGQSSGLTKSKSLTITESDVSKLVNIALQ